MSDTITPYSVIQLAGKQYTVSQGTQLDVNHINVEAGQTIEIADVLLYADDKKKLIGTPLIKGASVTLKVVSHQQGDKIRVATYKAKSRYRKVKGHRQPLTTVEVVKIAV